MGGSEMGQKEGKLDVKLGRRFGLVDRLRLYIFQHTSHNGRRYIRCPYHGDTEATPPSGHEEKLLCLECLNEAARRSNNVTE
jgi:hypothetical protein